MDPLEHLLFRSESESLDFKSQRYGDDLSSKAEIIKDILAFANSWRQETAFILIGVKEVNGSAIEVVGEKVHPKDADLQQLLKDKTQRPVQFSYRVQQLRGREIGVIEIPLQKRPLFLKQDYGATKAAKVYVRRGSSTAEALPDEISEMGLAHAPRADSAELCLEFVNEPQVCVGDSQNTESEVLVLDNPHIPQYASHQEFVLRSPLDRKDNPNYYRDLFRHYSNQSFFAPVNVALRNIGTATAEHVHAELRIADPCGEVEFRDELDGTVPESELPGLMDAVVRSRVASIASSLGMHPEVSVERIGDAWVLTFTYPRIQPGRTIWPPLTFFVGAKISKTFVLDGSIAATGLAKPATCRLSINIAAKMTRTSIGTLVDEAGRNQ